MELANASNASIRTASASATILNDDVFVAPEWAIVARDAVKAEGDNGTTTFAFAVTRIGDLSQPTMVSYAVAGAAANPADAADFGGTLPIGTISFQLSRFTRNDDGTGFNEAGRLQLLDAAGELVKEIFFYADALDGSRQLSVSVEEGFSQAVFSAGAQDGEDFVYGAYGNEAGSGFGSDRYSANGGIYGSEYLIDSVGFTTGYVDLLWAG